MVWLDNKEGFAKIDALGAKKEPFLFVISYDKSQIFASPLAQLDEDIFYKIGGLRNYPKQKLNKPLNTFTTHPICFTHYKASLAYVLAQIRSGNTYLLNLTFQTPIDTSLTLKEMFTYAKAKFKLYFKDEFICFSPERFIEIEGNTIATYPMKGTIDATLPHAKMSILSNPKEQAEHVMIVDLMRNDLGLVGNHVNVEAFRYVEEIEAGDKKLLQISSKITAQLPINWHHSIGTLLNQLLPAGSISGTPKKRTLEIIDEVENFKRGFYTGVFGVFDGENLYSSVMIRFIEKKQNQLYYKSGGGITIDSDAKSEYNELLDKIYLPLA